MSQPVSISKITPPHLPKILHRPRLLTLIEKHKDKKLILILGQAAQGKSTLAASYVKTLNTPTAWINLDKEDSDPVNLFHLTVQSLQYALKDSNFSNPPHSLQTMGLRSEIPLYREWTQSIFKDVPIPVQIVMDGLDRLYPDSSAFKFFQILVEEAPPPIHLMMLSREMPPLSFEFQHLKMKQEVSGFNDHCHLQKDHRKGLKPVT